jgi:hypothetical protein
MTCFQEYTYLWIDKKDVIESNLVEYDPVKYTETISYHNVMQRFTMLSDNPYVDKDIGFDYCNDCAVEAYIWGIYKKKFDESINVVNMVMYLSKLYGGTLSSNVHGYLFS